MAIPAEGKKVSITIRAIQLNSELVTAQRPSFPSDGADASALEESAQHLREQFGRSERFQVVDGDENRVAHQTIGEGPRRTSGR